MDTHHFFTRQMLLRPGPLRTGLNPILHGTQVAQAAVMKDENNN